MKTSKKCCQISKNRIIQRSENKKTFRINNNSERNITVCTIDGCMIKGESKRCDFGFIIEEETLYLVEFKGTDHSHAVVQIIETAEKLDVASFPGIKNSVIVGAPTPKATTTFQSTLKKYAKRYKQIGLGFPKRKNNIFEVTT